MSTKEQKPSKVRKVDLTFRIVLFAFVKLSARFSEATKVKKPRKARRSRPKAMRKQSRRSKSEAKEAANGSKAEKTGKTSANRMGINRLALQRSTGRYKQPSLGPLVSIAIRITHLARKQKRHVRP